MKLQRYSEKVLLAGIAGLLTGCAGSPVQTSRVTYENTIRDVVAAHCAECHGATAPSMGDFKKEKDKYTQEKLGPRMDTYENLMVMVNGSDTGAIMRRLDEGANTKDGKPGNMHKSWSQIDPYAPQFGQEVSTDGRCFRNTGRRIRWAASISFRASTG